MKYKVSLFIFVAWLGYFPLAYAGTAGVLLTLDEAGAEPKRYRCIEELNISGSGQFSEKNVVAMRKSTKSLWIIDLRRETHGFINGRPISWYFFRNMSNVDLTAAEILHQEEKRLAGLNGLEEVDVIQIKKKQSGKITQSTMEKIKPWKIESEAALCHCFHLHYLRLPVMDHHRPDDAIVDAFVAFVKQQPEGSWLHFHCRGGAGRTTTFMSLYDMLKNAKQESFEQIMERQHAAGGIDLLHFERNKDNAWKEHAFDERKKFLIAFYHYAASKDGYPKCTWSQYMQRA